MCSDPSSDDSPLGLTHVMYHYLSQKFIIWVKINCLEMSLKPAGTGIPRPRTVHKLLILLEMQHTDGVHAFKMAVKIVRKEGHWQVFVEHVSEIADNSRDASFLCDEDFTEITMATILSPEIKSRY